MTNRRPNMDETIGLNRLLTASVIAISLIGCAQTDHSERFEVRADISDSCAAFANANVDQSINVHISEVVTESDALPAYCRITGSITPNIGFEARLPITDWNNRYLQSGCGGFCGVVMPDKPGQSNAINYALKRGYATITTDAGHQGLHIGDGSWALNNREAEEVYAYKAIGATYDAAQTMIHKLYGQSPDWSYFSGCSNGGRMAVKAAQKYPGKFDGIIAGCPILNLSENGGIFGSWVLQANPVKDGERVLGPSFASKLPFFEAEIVKQCDPVDGTEDGIIAAPFACQVDLELIQTCNENSATDQCLTPSEKSTIAQFYVGATDSQGNELFYGMPPGSERYWQVWYLGNGNIPGPGNLLADGYGKYLGFENDPDGFEASDFDFDHDPARLEKMGELYNALNPDLTAFKKAGGKMIMWHGMADPLVLPQQSPAFYDSVTRAMGGLKDTQDFIRLFMAPGLGHCWELSAPTPDHMDLLGALEDWVEQGQAPDEIAITKEDTAENSVQSGRLRPYPLTAEYP